MDIVARNGEEWIKVSTITESRLVFEIAKAQWEAADSSSSEDEGKGGTPINGATNGQMKSLGEDIEMDRIELVKVVDDLLRASNAHRIHYKHPKYASSFLKSPRNHLKSFFPYWIVFVPQEQSLTSDRKRHGPTIWHTSGPKPSLAFCRLHTLH